MKDTDKTITKVLVIRFRRVGDAVLSSTICSSIKKSIPNSEVHYVLNEGIAPLFENHPAIDKLITFNSKELKSTFQYIKKVKQIVKEEKYDIIIDTRTTINTLLFALFSRKSKYRIGRKKSYNFKTLAHNYQIVNDADGKRDMIELTLELLKPLQKEYQIVKDENFKIYSTDNEIASFREYMKKQGVNLQKPVMLCAVATRLAYKGWPKDRMAEILKRILANYPEMQLIFNHAGDAEKTTATEIYNLLNKDKRIFINIEAKSLRELPAMMNNCDFFFGNEGGPRHIAQAVSLPTFAIYPPKVDKTTWLPKESDTNRGLALADISIEAVKDPNLTHEQKMDLLDVESVWIALNKMLNKKF